MSGTSCLQISFIFNVCRCRLLRKSGHLVRKLPIDFYCCHWQQLLNVKMILGDQDLFFCDFFFFWLIFLLLLFLTFCWIFFILLMKGQLLKEEEKYFFWACLWLSLPPASPSSFLPLFWLHCYAAVEFKQAQRGFIAKYRIFCFFWQVCLLSPRAPYVLFWLENYWSVYCEEELGCN